MAISTAIAGRGNAQGNGQRQAHGTVEPYEMSMFSYLCDGTTTVHLQINSTDPEFDLPKVAKKIMIKDYSRDGEETFYARNFHRQTLNNGHWSMTFDDLERHQVVTAHVLVQTGKPLTLKS